MNAKPSSSETKSKGSADKQKPKHELPGLPMARIRTIMRSTADAGNITADGFHLMTKSAEYFIQYLARNAFKITTASQLCLMKYEHVSELVHSKENLDFLQQIVPKKITVREYKKILAESEANGSDTSSESEAEETNTKKKPSKK